VTWQNILWQAMEYFATSHAWFVLGQQWFIDFEHGFGQESYRKQHGVSI
jgi:hypothetical protein